MQRRDLLRGGPIAIALGLAGCASSEDGNQENEGGNENGNGNGDGNSENGDGGDDAEEDTDDSVGEDGGGNDTNDSDGGGTDDSDEGGNGDTENGSEDEGEEDDDGDESEDDTEEEEGEEGDDSGGNVIVEAGESHSFEGSGAEVTDEFSLQEGIAEVEFNHDGERNFIVDMLDLEGDEFDDQLLVNVIGAIEGRSVIPTADSQYQIDVDADGGWSISLDQPEVTNDALEEAPLTAEGQGPDVIGPINLDDVSTVAGSHDGESNFIVEARTAEGGLSSWDLLFNEIGEFEGEAATRANGIAWIDVNADGHWTIEIE